MTEGDLLDTILDRLGRSDSASALFGSDEVVCWPSGALDALIKNGFLQHGPPAQVIECTNCEENCFMPVHVLPAENNRPARAFIACDKRDDVGRVPVALDHLQQWEMTGSRLAQALSTLFGFDKTPQKEKQHHRWKLGTLKSKARKGPVTLVIENGVSLKVAAHETLLTDVLTLNKSVLTLDKAELLRLVNKPAVSSTPGYKPSSVLRESRKLLTQQRYAAWRKAYRELKCKRPDMSDIWYSQQIAKSDVAYGRDADTIRKHMKK